MRQGGGEGKWWGREVMRKGSDEEGKWWRREVVMKGSGHEGKWWGREVVTKGSGEEGKWWGREVVTKGRRREVVRKGSGDEGKWWRMNVAWGLCWGGSRSTKPCVFPCKVAAADDERYLVCATGAAAVGLSFFLPQCNGGLKLLWVCLCVRSYRVFWNLRLQIALEWLHDSCHLVFWCCSVRR